MRKTFYKIKLVCSDGKELPITLATHDIGRIEELIERNKLFYKARGFDIQRFELVDTKYTINMIDEVYGQELMHCDIADDDADEQQHYNHFVVPQQNK